ncbi:sarcosine oxidase subunit gamma [Thalassobaculum litoreum]|uniref:Sarcosine oxidase subunit gamma n=1 Tax=Thalassobaculum litoreum DSM 18839 TaxID=1123362 RepID=A0A8G2BJR7_9PROT|nr:sarcosine oxidase subunit gamma family protein [Thalassobaculum litoreum]SDF86606.1 sarcosine oxidase subunit gamma [Thalassobaculum litoreum DSM 18839]
MADTAPQAFSPLSGHIGPVGGPHHAGVVLREVAGLSLINLRGDAEKAFAGHVETVLGVALPTAPNTAACTEGLSLLWLGPDEWLAVSEDGDSPALCARLEEAMSRVHHAVVDLSDNYAVIELSGHAARWVLAKGWPQDLHPSAFKPGQCSQGLLGLAQIVLEQTAEDAYRLFVRPSFAAYLWDWLVDASADVGVRVAPPDAPT